MNVCAAATTNVKWDRQTKSPCAQRNSTQQTVAQQNTQTQLEIKAPTLCSSPSSEHHASLGTSKQKCTSFHLGNKLRQGLRAEDCHTSINKTSAPWILHQAGPGRWSLACFVFRFRPSKWLQEYRTVGDTRWHRWQEVIWELTRSVRISPIQLECGWSVHGIAQM